MIKWKARHHLGKVVTGVAAGAIILTATGLVTAKWFAVQNENAVRASSYDINGYIKKYGIKPNKNIDKELHTFEMFKYSTSDKLPNGIVFHQTDNPGKNDTARNEADYEINGNWRNAFVHTFIDHSHILNIHDTNYGVWGAGPKANPRFVQFELCTEHNEADFAKSITNAAYYAAYILRQYGMLPTLGTSGSIWTHHQVTLNLGGTTHSDPDAYLAKWNYSTSKFLVLVKQYFSELGKQSSVGSQIKYDQYVSITKRNYTLWNDLQFTKKRGNTNTYKGQTLNAKYVYGNVNGSRYLSLYDRNNKWVGYLNQDAAKIAKGGQGNYISYGKYVTMVKTGYTVWKSFEWQKSGMTSTTTLNKTYLAKGEYKHMNGSTYLSLYDSKDNWKGYINADAMKVAKTAGGVGQNTANAYYTEKSTNYTIWNDFGFKGKRTTTKAIAGQTVQSKVKYIHVNGSTYLSLYRNDGSWIGYVNANAMKSVPAQGKHIAMNKYVTLTKTGYTIWRDFNWRSSGKSSTSLYEHTYDVQGEYKHFNGSTYLSLYDVNNKWIGYINANAGSLASSAGGKNLPYAKNMIVKSPNYTIWGDFNFKSKKGLTKNYAGQTVYAKYVYDHVNGSKYYSLYNLTNGAWLGYLNVNALSASKASVNPVQVPANLYGVNTAGLTSANKTFLTNLFAYAVPLAKKYGIYPSILAMQAIRESGWGTSELAKNANAYFGIKADASWHGASYAKVTSEEVNGKLINVTANFRKYSSLPESIEGYAIKVTTSGLYPGLLKKNSATWTMAAEALKIYATDSTYVDSIKTGINKYQLYKLDAVK